ncbi:MAG: hypothetical protein HS115_05220 [Spirochaetales bacterium]|nr:hypothetical protein [Spirochaetales bacterium]
MIRRMIGPMVVMALVACGGPSDADVDEAIGGIKDVYSGFFAVLEKNQANPAAAFAEGEKYIESKKDELGKHGKLLGGGIKASQFEKVEQFREDIQTMSREAGGRLSSLAQAPGGREKLGSLMEKLGSYYVSGAQAAEGSSIGGSIARKAAKKTIIMAAKAAKDSTPAEMRDQMLDGYVESIAAQGADKAEQDEFRAELKSELGW